MNCAGQREHSTKEWNMRENKQTRYIVNFLTERQLTMRVIEETSETYSQGNGIPQESVL